MRYGKLYKVGNVNSKLINESLSHIDFKQMKRASVADKDAKKPIDQHSHKDIKHEMRTNSVTFIYDKTICRRWLNVAKQVNKDLGWDFELSDIEPIQYGEYAESQQYAWHVDQHNQPYKDNNVRKMSFSVFLNDDYTGGEFDLEIHGPTVKGHRYKTFSKLPINSILFFQSDYWHRVRPVTDGVRKSMVGWVLGPKYK